MFTGLVETTGEVMSLTSVGDAMHLVIRAPFAEEVAIGDSISVDGCCLTAIATSTDSLTFQAGFETLKKTTLGSLEQGSRINLERAMRADSRLGGHFVQGHVDGVGVIKSKQLRDEWAEVWFDIGALAELLVPKGSVAVDGISLTVVDVAKTEFSVMLVPHTLAMTSLGWKNVGDRVNIETDILGKYVHKMIEQMIPRQGSR